MRTGAASFHPRMTRVTSVGGVRLADADSLGLLPALGIVKDQPFTPDTRTHEILDLAARTGYRMSRVIGFEDAVSGRSFRVYKDRRWLNPMADATQEKPSGPLDLAWHRTASNNHFPLGRARPPPPCPCPGTLARAR